VDMFDKSFVSEGLIIPDPYEHLNNTCVIAALYEKAWVTDGPYESIWVIPGLYEMPWLMTGPNKMPSLTAVRVPWIIAVVDVKAWLNSGPYEST